jgi:hypothetical protein
MLGTGLWRASLAWPFTVRWLQWPLCLWVVGVAILGRSCAVLRKQRGLHATEGSASARYRRASSVSRQRGDDAYTPLSLGDALPHGSSASVLVAQGTGPRDRNQAQGYGAQQEVAS